MTKKLVKPGTLCAHSLAVPLSLNGCGHRVLGLSLTKPSGLRAHGLRVALRLQRLLHGISVLGLTKRLLLCRKSVLKARQLPVVRLLESRLVDALNLAGSTLGSAKSLLEALVLNVSTIKNLCTHSLRAKGSSAGSIRRAGHLIGHALLFCAKVATCCQFLLRDLRQPLCVVSHAGHCCHILINRASVDVL